MNIIEHIGLFLDNLDRKEFYRYLVLYIAAVLMLVGLLTWRYYARISSLHNAIEETHEKRELVSRMLRSALRLQKQRSEVNTLLAQGMDTKIGQFFEDSLKKFNLKDNQTVGEYSHIDHKNGYRENILRAHLVDIDMKELTELLQAIESNKHVFIKELEISASKKKHTKIDVSLTLDTLELKPTSI